jgi:gamma-glutamyl:cysteine ligase YbdK (ATP-grasp superfamily)
MPTAMHPWMDPARDAFLWTKENGAVYRAYERIFDTKSHGWANVQSIHVNLPFADDVEFERLLAAVRLIVPIIPALAASSPIADSRFTGFADYRMEVYRTNSSALKSITGEVVPESISDRSEYESTILAPMYREIRPLDPMGILQHEWLNSRGAIARFDRNAIEIRVCDTQECAPADIAVAAGVAGAVRTLYASRGSDLSRQRNLQTARLAQLFASCVRDAERTVIADEAYLAAVNAPVRPCPVPALWSFLIEQAAPHIDDARILRNLGTIVERGPLARRILRAVGDDYSRRHLKAVYQALCDCLQQGSLFLH